MDDEIFPIEDSMIPLQHGNVKEARYVVPSHVYYMYKYSDFSLQFRPKFQAHGGTSRGPYYSQMDRRAVWYWQTAKDLVDTCELGMRKSSKRIARASDQECESICFLIIISKCFPLAYFFKRYLFPNYSCLSYYDLQSQKSPALKFAIVTTHILREPQSHWQEFYCSYRSCTMVASVETKTIELSHALATWAQNVLAEYPKCCTLATKYSSF